MKGEWSATLSAFWFGANGCEFIAFRGSHQIFVYPCDEYPSPPSEVWQYHEKINTAEQFDDALNNHIKYKAVYSSDKRRKD